MKVVIKLGGSVIVEKHRNWFPTSIEEITTLGKEYIRYRVLKRLCKEISQVIGKEDFLFLVNGAGIFGHYLVNYYFNNKDFDVLTIHRSVSFLNSEVVKTLKDFGLKVKTIHPFESCKFTKNGFDVDKLLKSLTFPGFFSSYGDIIPTVGLKGRLEKYEIISGDDLIVKVSEVLKPERLIVVTDVDGVYTKDPKIFKDAERIKVIDPLNPKFIDYSNYGIDVTGGMKSKVEKLSKLAINGIESQIISGLIPGNLRRALSGDKTVGTLIKISTPLK
ncbi:MAG TPA: hypothetical protein ENG45_01320 [Candidatus Aenigmarchaeota archaeon]|nr:hypothetical protein [Candidatus Aenigmarchaeota archaeon]